MRTRPLTMVSQLESAPQQKGELYRKQLKSRLRAAVPRSMRKSTFRLAGLEDPMVQLDSQKLRELEKLEFWLISHFPAEMAVEPVCVPREKLRTILAREERLMGSTAPVLGTTQRLAARLLAFFRNYYYKSMRFAHAHELVLLRSCSNAVLSGSVGQAVGLEQLCAQCAQRLLRFLVRHSFSAPLCRWHARTTYSPTRFISKLTKEAHRACARNGASTPSRGQHRPAKPRGCAVTSKEARVAACGRTHFRTASNFSFNEARAAALR